MIDALVGILAARELIAQTDSDVLVANKAGERIEPRP